MEHIHRDINHNGKFEVTLVETVPTRSYRVRVTHEANRTYFGCPHWRELTEVYGMEAETKRHFYLDNAFDTIYFFYRSSDNSPTSPDTENYDPRDADGVVVYYPVE